MMLFQSFKQTNKYILAQTPLTATIEDFLGFVLQENCSCIIALDDIEHTRKQVGIHVVFFRFLKYKIRKHVFLQRKLFVSINMLLSKINYILHYAY